MSWKIKRDPLDTLFSEVIRKRAIKLVGGCEICLKPKYDIQKDNGDIYPSWMQLQTSHYHGREEKSVRFDEDNAIGVCGKCHQYLGAHPHEHSEIFKKRLGEEGYDLLRSRIRYNTKLDRKAIELHLKALIKDIGDLNDI